VSVGTLVQGEREFTVLSALVTLPLRGISSFRLEVDADEDDPIAEGRALLRLLADNGGEPEEFNGTIENVDAETHEGRATCVMVAGRGMLAKALISAKTYQQAPFPVDISAIATDAIIEAGEDFEDDIALATITIPRWHRVSMTAAQLLDRLAERFGFNWRMNNAGRVEFFVEEWSNADELAAGLIIEENDNAHDRTMAGSVSRASLRPGTIVRDRRIEEVHYLLDEDGLRVMLRWGTGLGAGGLREDHTIAVKRSLRPFEYYCPHEVTVRRQNLDGSLDVEADDPAIGGLTAVPYYPGVVVCRLNVAERTRALLAFIGGDESKPCIVGFERFVEPGLVDSPFQGRAVARVNDSVPIGTITFIAASDGSGGISAISIAYTGAEGSTQNIVVAPTLPASINLTGIIATGSPEVFLRADS
jgi:hypothetical protein